MNLILLYLHLHVIVTSENLYRSPSLSEIISFLMGLNEVYNEARCQILMMSPLPSVSKAYAMIMADESRRETAGI